jgi:3'-phosphoadenosine 5'-phosphosulfate sulfotransferase (PAPS reductase)/FAD synthetase
MTDDLHVALCSGGSDSVAATHAAMVFGPAELVVYLDTGTGPGDGAVAANGDWIEQWCDDNGWPFRRMETSEDYETLVAEHGYPGPSRHMIMYSSLKDRQLCQLAKEVDGDLYCWTGVRKHESEKRMRHSYDDSERGDGRWYWRSPLAEFTDDRVEEYRDQFDLPVSDVTEAIGRSADCWCGCFGDRGELIDLAAAGFDDHADWLESLPTPDDVDREQDRWAGYNWDKHDFAADDDLQTTLCSSCSPPTRTGGGDDV